jgi:predicted 3-demethylubiquinone-9 3-methyltransferase (glyoxalase superfamily)
VPAAIGEMMKDKDNAKIRRVTEAMLPMSKIDIAELRKAYDGEAAA